MPAPVPSPQNEAGTPTSRCSPRHSVVRSSRWPAGCTSGGPQSFAASKADANSSRDSHCCRWNGRWRAQVRFQPAAAGRPCYTKLRCYTRQCCVAASRTEFDKDGARALLHHDRLMLPRRRRISERGAHQQYERASDCAAEPSPPHGPTSQRSAQAVLSVTPPPRLAFDAQSAFAGRNHQPEATFLSRSRYTSPSQLLCSGPQSST